MGMRLVLRTLVLAGLLLTAGAGLAHAEDPAFEASLSPTRVAFGGADPEARLTVRTGSEAETFWFSAYDSGPAYVDFEGRRAGSALLATGCREPRAEGPAPSVPRNAS